MRSEIDVHYELMEVNISLFIQAVDIVDKKFPHFKDARQLKPDDLARAVLYAVTQPSYVAVQEIMVQPTDLQIQ